MRTTTTPTTTSRSRLALAAVPAALAVALALGACGDDEPDTLSEDEFIEQANAACTEGVAGMEEALAPVFTEDEPTPEAIETAYGALLEQARQITSDIRALDEPEDMQDDVEAWVDAVDARTDELEGADPEEVFAADDEDPWAETNEQAADLGLDACAQS